MQRGWVFDSAPLPLFSGESHVVCTVFFVPHDLQIFFLFNPPPPSQHVNVALARQERQNSCGCTEQFPIN